MQLTQSPTQRSAVQRPLFRSFSRVVLPRCDADRPRVAAAVGRDAAGSGTEEMGSPMASKSYRAALVVASTGALALYLTAASGVAAAA